MIENKNKAEDIIKNLVDLVGVIIGIIIASIGTIMFLDSIFKLYIFNLDSGRYDDSTYRCEQYDIDNIEARRLVGIQSSTLIGGVIDKKMKINEKNNIKKLNKEDKEFLRKKYQECKKESKEKNKKSFEKGEKMDIADGISFMFVGFILLFFYQRRKKLKK